VRGFNVHLGLWASRLSGDGGVVWREQSAGWRVVLIWYATSRRQVVEELPFVRTYVCRVVHTYMGTVQPSVVVLLSDQFSAQSPSRPSSPTIREADKSEINNATCIFSCSVQFVPNLSHAHTPLHAKSYNKRKQP
jgi:hypothetical protein